MLASGGSEQLLCPPAALFKMPPQSAQFAGDRERTVVNPYFRSSGQAGDNSADPRKGPHIRASLDCDLGLSTELQHVRIWRATDDTDLVPWSRRIQEGDISVHVGQVRNAH